MPREHAIGFRPVAAADLPLLRSWLEAPHMRRWWGEPETELGYIRDMVEGRDTTRSYLIMLEDKPVGYIQCWHVGPNRIEPWVSEAPWMMDLPDDAVGVDLSIGDPEMLSKGLGSAALAVFVAMLRAEGHETIVIDPDSANGRAVRAYEKAGFRAVPALQGRTGGALIMQHDETLTKAQPT